METVAASPKGKSSSALLIVLLVILLIGAGIGGYQLLKPKTNDDEEDYSEVPGRKDLSAQKPVLTPELIAKLFGKEFQEKPVNDGPGTTNNPLYYKDSQAQDLIKERAQVLQSDERFMDIFRAKYNIGNALIKYNTDAQQAIDKMMAKLNGVDIDSKPDTRYLTFPIYGTYESKGKALRSELQFLLDRGIKGLNLSLLRDKDQPWFLDSIELNLLVGTTNAFVPTADNIWWEVGFREELDHFKGMNGHWTSDKYLVKIVDDSGAIEIHPWDVGAKAAYPAGTLYTFAERWVEAIDHLDKVTEWEALRHLQSEQGGNWVFTFVDPSTGVDHLGTIDPSRDPDIDFFEGNNDPTNKGGKGGKMNT